MGTRNSAAATAALAAFVHLTSAACGIVAPGCTDESGQVVNTDGHVAAGQVATYTVVSPRHSNLIVRLTWPDSQATLGLRATITACGQPAGCDMSTFGPAPAPGGPSPIPQPWPAGFREMLVDGTRGKTYRIEIAGDAGRDSSFSLDVTWQVTCES